MFAELKDLSEKITSAGLVSPTLIIIGKVVELSPFWPISTKEESCLMQAWRMLLRNDTEKLVEMKDHLDEDWFSMKYCAEWGMMSQCNWTIQETWESKQAIWCLCQCRTSALVYLLVIYWISWEELFQNKFWFTCFRLGIKQQNTQISLKFWFYRFRRPHLCVSSYLFHGD